jgi:hypothetical protein
VAGENVRWGLRVCYCYSFNLTVENSGRIQSKPADGRKGCDCVRSMPSKREGCEIHFPAQYCTTVQRECGQRRGGKTVTGLWIGATLPCVGL